MRRDRLVRQTLLAALLALLCLIPAARPAGAAPPATASPHYFYDRQTAFLINYGVDPLYGGLYTAVDIDGSLIEEFLPVDVWGFPPDVVRGVSKGHLGQATCIRYFIGEQQRTLVSGVGMSGVNALLLPGRAPLGQPTDLLSYARSCADFLIAHMEIAPDDGVPEPIGGNGLYPPGADQGDVAIPGRLYYWGFTGRDGRAELIDDTLPNGGRSSSRTESIIPWSLAELALALQQAGRPESEWAPYRDAALRWWSWRRDQAAPLPPFGDPSQPAYQDGCGGLPDNPDNCIPGVARDVFYPALGFTLAEVTGDASYRTGDGSQMADGRPYGAAPFANSILGTGASADLTFPPPHALQDGSSPAGLARAIIYGKHLQRNLGPQEERDQWWDFSPFPALQEDGGGYRIRPLSDPFFRPEILGRPFTHLAGRELIASTQRAHWVFYTFGVNPATFYADPDLNEQAFRQATYDFWVFVNQTFWDETPGAASWLEAVGHPYKPCFAGGTELPFADWLAPTIGGKEHAPAIPAPGQPVTVTVSSVADPPWPYLNLQLKGSGVAAVEVRYSVDGGATWSTLAAVPVGDVYQATIPGQPGGTRVLYYARVRDVFANQAAFPAGAERWDSAGGSTVVPSAAQEYSVPEFTAVELLSFTAAREAGGVRLRWETAAEVDTLGFHLFRGASDERGAAVQITSSPIPAQGQGGGGASYSWLDAGAPAGDDVVYWLQEVEQGGAVHEYGPLRVGGELFGGYTTYLPFVARP